MIRLETTKNEVKASYMPVDMTETYNLSIQ